MAKIWTEENEEYIRQNFRHRTYADLAEHFGVSQKAMESKIRRMGLKKQDYKDPDPVEAIIPVPAEEEEPAETGPTPIKSGAPLPRKEAQPAETPEEREARLHAELESAERSREERTEQRSRDDVAAAIERFESGIESFHDGSYGKALDAFQKVIDESPPDPILVARARQYKRACERHARTDRFSPEDADDHWLLGVVRLNEGDAAGALEAFDEALDQAPGDDRIVYCQAAAHAQRGDYDAAIEALREAVDINDANRIYAVNDPDFVSLRVHEDFRDLVAPDDEED